MKNALFVGLLILSFACQSTKEEKIKVNGKTYQLSFSDEFNQSSLNEKKWQYRTDSKHWSTQLPENVQVSDGLLHLRGQKEKSGGKDYTGAGIISIDTFQYGYYEVRMKIPKGAGWHTSFWLMNHDGTGGTGSTAATIEIDICENDSKNSNGYSVNLHKWKGGHVDMKGMYIPTANLAEDFHLFSCEYTPDYVKYYFDNKEVRTIDIKDLPQGSVNIWITTIASYLDNTKAVDESQLPVSAIVDYVRFYKHVGSSNK